MVPFNNNIVTDVNLLFGRKKLLETLDKYILSNINLSIIGTRRFGKTSLLRTVQKKLIKQGDEAPCIPIYMDFKGVCSIVNNTAGVYRYIISLIVAELFKQKIFTSREVFPNNIEIIPSDNWNNVFCQLEKYDTSEMLGLFIHIMPWFADLCERPFFLLFDEYEFLIKHTFDKADEFFNLNNS
ncbi:MAG: hypothetical protein IK075_04410 [Prevotella sp.]|nr:hypothetical protein [Prevotella sp.]